MNNEEEIEKSVDVFLAELNALCLKHNLSISHEDGHGAFVIEEYDQYNIKWINKCGINIKEYQSYRRVFNMVNK